MISGHGVKYPESSETSFPCVRISVEKDGFHNAVCWLPEYQWEKVHGYSEAEMTYFKKLIRNNAHLILEFSQDGGILNNATTA